MWASLPFEKYGFRAVAKLMLTVYLTFAVAIMSVNFLVYGAFSFEDTFMVPLATFATTYLTVLIGTYFNRADLIFS